jgi:hypothetical protein
VCVVNVESNELGVAMNFNDAVFLFVERYTFPSDLITGETSEFLRTSGYEVSLSAGFVAERYLAVVLETAGPGGVGEPRNLTELAKVMSSSRDQILAVDVPILGARRFRVGEPDDQVARIDFSSVLLDEVKGTEEGPGNDLLDDRASCGKS